MDILDEDGEQEAIHSVVFSSGLQTSIKITREEKTVLIQGGRF